MFKRLAILAFFLLAVMVSTGANASGLFGTASETGVAVTAPLYSENPSEQFATGELQFDAMYRDVNVWSYDGATGEYAGSYPTGMGADNDIVLHFYPNILTSNLAVEAVAVGEAELVGKLAYVYDKKSKTFEFKAMDGLFPIGRDENGRFAGNIVLDKSVPEGSHVMRVYALVRDARRVDKALLIFFHWARKGPGAGLVDTLRFRTERWLADTPAPDANYLTDLLCRAGNGGTGQVFSRLITADQADADRIAAEAQERQRALDANAALIEEASRVANSQSDAIGALTANQQKLTAGIDANTQGIADLGARVGALENWAANASQPAEQPAITPTTAQMVRFRIAFVRASGQSMRATASTAGLPLVAVQMEYRDGVLKTGYLQGGVAEYLNTGIASGTVMVFRACQLNGRWSDPITLTITEAMEGQVMVVPVAQ